MRTAILTCPLAAALLGLPLLDSAPAQSPQNTNSPPVFSSDTASRTVAEGAAANANVGAAVTATDPDNDTLSYSLDTTTTAPDAGKFAIDSGSGQITVNSGTTLDYEHWKKVYWVVVKATDPSGASDTIEVTISVTDDAAETLNTLDGPTSVNYSENKSLRVAAYPAYADSDKTNLTGGVTYSLTGADAGQFSMTDGVLRFRSSPDYESPDDLASTTPANAAANNQYVVTVTATDSATTPNTASRTVVVSVTDVDETGRLTLSSSRPKMNTALTATVSDPDGAVVGTPTWKWERSAGRSKWTTIDTATMASYTPSAADAGHFLRVTAIYTDGHGSGKQVKATTSEVVIARTLSQLAVTTASSRPLSPAFDSETLHYAVGCTAPFTLTLSTADTDTRLAVNGLQRGNRDTTVSLTGLSGGDDISIVLTGPDGASTTYTLSCLPENFPAVTTQAKSGAGGVIEDLMMFRNSGYVMVIDPNGVPRWYKATEAGIFFRVFPEGRYRYGYTEPDTSTNAELVVLDDDFKEVTRSVHTVSPLTLTDPHDFVIRPNGDYVLMSYEPASRDLSFITARFGVKKGSDSNGTPVYPGDSDYGTAGDYGVESVNDSAAQVVRPGSSPTAQFTWNSWGKVALEDCTQHRFLRGYGHINSLDIEDGDIIAGLRGCSKVYRIDPDSGTIVWRVGRSNRTRAEWQASRTSGSGPAPLGVVNDPAGEFCGQHAAQILENGHLLLYDNGIGCVKDPKTGNSVRTSEVYSRAVEYALDPDNFEAVFVRDHSFGNTDTALGYSGGHVEPLDNGDWLISWGNARKSDQSAGKAVPTVSATQVDPDTHEEKFSVTLPGDYRSVVGRIRAIPVSPWRLAAGVKPLTVLSATHSATHTGPSDAPTVVVAFNQPVKDFDTTTPSVSVSGATVASVSPHTRAGAPANAYIFTLTPAGSGSITFRLVAARTCADKGICTAGGAVLTSAVTRTIPYYDSNTGDGVDDGGGGGSGQPADQHGNTPATATAIAVGSSTPGQINARSDRDYFSLTVSQAGLLVVETIGSVDTQGTLTTPDGQVLAQADTGGVRRNFQVTQHVTPGTYLVAVSGTRTGSYRLAVDLIVGFVDNPQPHSAQSGIGVLSGWVCEAETVEVELNGVPRQAAYGTERTDTREECGDTNNGFGLLWNWNLLGDGPHTVRVVVDGVAFATLPVTVTTLGLNDEFPKGLTGETTLMDFPTEGESVRLEWQEAQQNFALAEGPVTRQGSTRNPNWAVLGNPAPGSYQSGIRVLSGWVCEAEAVVLEVDGVHRLVAAYGTERADTEEKCGDTNNGFGLLWNWNLLGAGEHRVRLLVDAEEWATATFTVMTLGAEMRRGLTHTAVVKDFPSPGEVVTVEWQEAQQNFVITGVGD